MPLEGAGEKIVGDFAWRGRKGFVFFATCLLLSVLQFPDVGVVLTEKTNAGGITVYELVSLGRHPYTSFFGQLKKQDREIIEQSLEAAGIAHKANNYVSELSDGERQKAMIAKALAQQCPIILLDEPTAFLDVTSRIETMVLLHRLAVDGRKAILLSTHDIEQALVLADKLWLLSKENGLQCGVTEDMILSHRMDGLFSRNDIRFDYAHGVYYPKVDSHRRISVEANDEVLLHWTTNALNRHGYACHPVSSPETNESPRLQVLAADHFILHTEEQNEYHSFEQLLANI